MSRQLRFLGQVCSTPSAGTITIDGTQAFSGQIGTGQPLEADITFTTVTLNDAPDTESTVSVTFAVTSGVLRIGSMVGDTGPVNGNGRPTWDVASSPLTSEQKAIIGGYVDGTSLFYAPAVERTSILINGVPPEYPATPVVFDPGPVDDPAWDGWAFEVSAGETLTCTVTIPPTGLNYFN